MRWSNVCRWRRLVPNLAAWSCALQREILIHGRLYLSKHTLSFRAKLFSFETTVILYVTAQWAQLILQAADRDRLAREAYDRARHSERPRGVDPDLQTLIRLDVR